MALLAKEAGGVRPIGVFPSWHRVWGKARRVEAQLWEDPRDFWAAGANRGASDVVWRQACKAESGSSRGLVSASIVWGLRKYDERAYRFELFMG
eukprot:921169-Pyramimonas_sp.AAC.1